MKKVFVKDVWNYFNYRRLCGDDSSLLRQIHDADVNRPGLELSGYFTEHIYRRVVILGEKEIGYIKTMSEQAQKKAFDYLTDDSVPMILISRDLACPDILLEIAQSKNFPIFSSFAPTSSLIVEIVSFLEEYFAQVDSLHGVLLQIYGRGILITGESGIGKSEIALELVKKGHILVADDRVDVYRTHNHISGEAPEVLKNMLEVRGIGIIDITRMFGVAASADKTQIDYVIHLQKWRENEQFDRIGGQEEYFTVFGIKIPMVTIPVSEGRSIAVLVESAVNNFILRSKGFNSSQIMEERVINYINKQKEEA
ncbi:MAG: HPr(Ser) kinase/phosphatase [Erysipelotrichia bacterium]|nr:HPr(Ser) kinase/phosphatase [Erysipelotrichia bacterium]